MQKMQKLKYTISLSKIQAEFLGHFIGNGQIRPTKGHWLLKEMNISENKAKNLAQELYGILGISEYSMFASRIGRKIIFYSGFFIPEENLQPIILSAQTLLFEKQLYLKDLATLKVLLNRAIELRNGSKWQPRFTIAEMAKLTGMKKYATEASLNRLVGILAKTNHYSNSPQMEIKDSLLGVNIDSYVIYSPRWFLPNSRFELAVDLTRDI